MEGYDFSADSGFFLDNYTTLVNLHPLKWIAVRHKTVVYVGSTSNEVMEWAKTFGILGQCSILEVSPAAFRQKKEGVPV